ncbi:UvrD-helicase domain-containing protein [Oryzobacter terrae]|uniref:UvrD-helicase domain-containing protein n=1 Tax=Oryzobacter terrae TaxID=1620385 RepID=UPI00366D8844
MSDPGPRWSAAGLARALGQSYAPTPEQAAVIEAPLRPVLVVAGAGSGKTETMAARVVWLVANGLVRPDEVLGLTFTRKAAGELSERLATRLTALREAGIWAPPEEDGAVVLDDVPTVSTYHAYAGRIVREHGLRVGVEPESRLLTEAAAWQFAHEAVVAWDGPMDEVDKAESTVTTAVVDLAGELAEHLVGPPALAAHLHAVVAALEAVPKGEGTRKRTNPMRDVVGVLRQRAAVVPVLERYQELKRSRDAMDFADQMALAARIAAEVGQVGVAERGRFKAVLLDEFQDTSEAQLQLLRSLFVAPGSPVPVTAVGDPHQSIYGWRGASSTTLDRFRDDFRDPEPARVLHLSTSWRNDRAVLTAANVVAGPLAATTRVPVEPLVERPGAGPGHVSAARLETVEDEARHVVDWVSSRLARPGRRTAAVLCRKRSQFDPVVEALELAQVPYEVVGLGGLLHTPEVADLVALLHVVQDPTRGDRLMRLLTGSSCRLGAADLDGLGAWSRVRQRSGRGDRRADLSPDASERTSIVEALDDLPPATWVGDEGQRLSPVALPRLEGLGAAVRRLRALTGLGLPELVAEAETSLGLDIEVLARPGYSPGAARAHLDAFADVAATFAASADRATLGGFLAWLEAAVDEERGLDLGWVEARPDAVQVMTVHAAKGLEWDVVAVPGLVESSFPAHSATQGKVVGEGWGHGEPSDKGWLVGLATLPYDLRGDRAGLPRFGWGDEHDWDSVAEAFDRFTGALADHGIAEERRLGYVALTRARTDLLLTAHVWGSASTPRVTSRFLEEVRSAGGDGVAPGPWVAMPPVDDPRPQNPRTAEVVSVTWPTLDHVARRERLLEPARAVVAAAAAGAAPGSGSWDAEVSMLLDERARRRSGADVDVELPPHLSTSALVSLADDAEQFTLDLRRPLPQPPALATRRGTAFHAWVEEHYSRAAFVDVDALPGSADDDASDADLGALREAFLASEWADRMPAEVETSVETVVDGIAVRGRIDAVFEEAGPDGAPCWVVVDWKTGAPATGRRATARAVQLGAYRLAWARLRGVDPGRVRGAFFHAATGQTLWPALPDAAEITRVLAAARPR